MAIPDSQSILLPLFNFFDRIDVKSQERFPEFVEFRNLRKAPQEKGPLSWNLTVKMPKLPVTLKFA